jgi:hypothetical protein
MAASIPSPVAEPAVAWAEQAPHELRLGDRPAGNLGQGDQVHLLAVEGIRRDDRGGFAAHECRRRSASGGGAAGGSRWCDGLVDEELLELGSRRPAPFRWLEIGGTQDASQTHRRYTWRYSPRMHEHF